MDQGGGIEGVPGSLRGQPRGCEFPQLLVNEREQVGRRLAVAGCGGFEEVSDLAHTDRVYRIREDRHMVSQSVSYVRLPTRRPVYPLGGVAVRFRPPIG
jgi:hypothetical protein